MRIARIARPGAIYDSSAVAQTFSAGATIDILEEKDDISENEEKKTPRKKARIISSTYRVFGVLHGWWVVVVVGGGGC